MSCQFPTATNGIWQSLPIYLGAVLAILLTSTLSAAELPIRVGERPSTTDDVPHVQIGHSSPPEISAKLLKCVDNMQGVDVRETIISLPGAKGFWLDDASEVANPQAIVRGREFAHIHPDGSLHASLEPIFATSAVASGWAILHPWSQQGAGWKGFVMIYSPTNEDELETVLQLIAASYNYVTGENISAPNC